MERSDLERQAARFISRFLVSEQPTRDTMRAEGAALANRLRQAAMDLAMSRATEFSPQIPRYHLLAAKVALLAHGPDSSALHSFEQDIRYYRGFESALDLVEEYEAFREAYTASRGS